MAKFTYYALGCGPEGPFLPEPARGRDFAMVRPSSFAYPRLFKSESVAAIALSVWLRGQSDPLKPENALTVVPLTLST